MTYIKTIENALGQEARKNFLTVQPGDVVAHTLMLKTSGARSDSNLVPR